MRLPVIAEGDLNVLTRAFPDLDFGDAELRAVLLASGAVDINAAPGSGKTTLLAAKLLLLAQKWPSERCGICVLSHTNVAQEEVKRRLATSVHGARLLEHPHFIGTIHGFVNQFLALPFLRSEDLIVDVIDNDVFARKALKASNSSRTLWGWRKNNPSADDVIAGLEFRGHQLDLTSTGGNLPGSHTNTYKALLAIKQTLAAQGVYRHGDMFAFAERLLQARPRLGGQLSRRFPLLMIDEMQDTSWAQEELLARLFNDSVVIQRFGDINQRILNGDEQAERLTFPRPEFLGIRTSKRFCPAIARAVACVQQAGEPVTSTRRESTHRPTLILYETANVTKVVERYGELVLEAFDDKALASAAVRAVCTRKQGEAHQTPGRHLADYWPAYKEVGKSHADTAWSLLSSKEDHLATTGGLSSRVERVRRVALYALKELDVPLVDQCGNGAQLFRLLRREGIDIRPLQAACRRIVLNPNPTSSEENWDSVPNLLYPALEPLIPGGILMEEFRALEVFTRGQAGHHSSGDCRNVQIVRNGRSVQVTLGTVLSMKGETHLSTLVLESFGRSRRFDLEHALPLLSGREPFPRKASKTFVAQLRNLYVGMSRPTHHLCLAMNAARSTQQDLATLERAGWTVDRILA